MVSRRSFLVSTSIVIASWLFGCGENKAALKVLLLQGSIPPQLLKSFRKQLKISELAFEPEAQLAELFELLKAWQKQQVEESPKQLPLLQTRIPDLVTLGDYWLAEAIREQLIQPLDIAQLAQWQQLPPSWQNLVKRDESGFPDENGKIWGAPYRWGNTLIAYRQDKFKELGWLPGDWSDLWREELKERIALLDQPREVIGLTLKKLGYSYNTLNLNEIPELKSQLLALQEQAKYYSSDSYLQPLILGDVWLAVGWSTDILPIMARYPQIKAVVPRSGTSLWSDLWVKPRLTADNISSTAQLANQWIDFCWQSLPAQQISLFTDAVSPAIFTLQPTKLSQDIRDNPLRLVDKQILDNSDFLLPLPPEVEERYQSLWREIRES